MLSSAPFRFLTVACLVATASPLLAQAERFCPSGANSATIRATGSTQFDANGGAGNLTLHATGVQPGSVGLFVHGLPAEPTPLGQGFLCLGAPVIRMEGLQTGTGTVSYALDYLTLDPTSPITPGATVAFQFWFRAGTTSDLTDAIALQMAVPQPVDAFATIDQGTSSGHSLAATEDGGALVITDQRTWAAFHEEHTSNVWPTPPLPEVDFSRSTVVAVFAGTRPTSGYTLGVQGLTLDVTTVDVSTLELGPSGGLCPVFPALTQPFHVVAIARVEDATLGTVDRQSLFYVCD